MESAGFGVWTVGEMAEGTRVLCQTDDLTMLTIGGRDAVIERHRHDRHDEFGLLVEGSGSLTIGDETVRVRAGSTWAIPRGTPHGGRYDGGFRVVVWFTPWEDLENPDRVILD